MNRSFVVWVKVFQELGTIQVELTAFWSKSDDDEASRFFDIQRYSKSHRNVNKAALPETSN